ncbi:hypothetical protein [Pelagicoccus sp. SDUM812005]|uniref:hypothetical protein n=1 Tax=Pelagicoccus sp. SDUM812005 TaxID=3041257 RepID=UPI00280D5AAA|nr:hypothetical protein [Pelagicoccus sp. SDUM812005]MDQ8181877.1 hypothetical protein [Pelagicoccus sp. SDUM812005]
MSNPKPAVEILKRIDGTFGEKRSDELLGILCIDCLPVLLVGAFVYSYYKNGSPPELSMFILILIPLLFFSWVVHRRSGKLYSFDGFKVREKDRNDKTMNELLIDDLIDLSYTKTGPTFMRLKTQETKLDVYVSKDLREAIKIAEQGACHNAGKPAS